jgi:hypothetical protein
MDATVTRAEHLAWSKARALQYVEQGDLTNAWTSMVSDLGKHPDTQGHAALELGMMLLIAGQLGTPTKMREFIEGFN